MRKIFLIISCLFIFVLVSCGKIQKSEPVNDLNLTIAHQLQALDNNYSDETLKALSIALRNNTMINHNEINDEKVELKYLNIARSTDGKVLKNNKDDLIEISFNKTEDYAWQKNIKKNQILEFALQNNISLTSLTNIEPITEDERVVGLKIGNQVFEYQTLADYFNLESNKIESILSTKNEIIIKGIGNDFYNHFDIEKAEQLSKNNYNYSEILNILFNNLEMF